MSQKKGDIQEESGALDHMQVLRMHIIIGDDTYYIMFAPEKSDDSLFVKRSLTVGWGIEEQVLRKFNVLIKEEEEYQEVKIKDFLDTLLSPRRLPYRDNLYNNFLRCLIGLYNRAFFYEKERIFYTMGDMQRCIGGITAESKSISVKRVDGIGVISTDFVPVLFYLRGGKVSTSGSDF